MHAKLGKSLTAKEGAGVIYILRDPTHPKRGYKIGETKERPYKVRIKQHWQGCGFVPDVVWVSSEIPYRKRAESLIKLDLADRRQIFDCKGHKGKDDTPKVTRHKEWFNVTRDEAEQTAKKWVDFMEVQRPYDMWKQLSPVWIYHLGRRRQPPSTSGDDHNARREQWKQILSKPTRLEELSYNIHTLKQYWQSLMTSIRRNWSFCAQFFWQTMTLIAWFIVLLVLQNTFAATAFAFVLVCAWFSIVPDGLPQGLPSKRKAKK
ncbi:hypothetical protein FB567DRAFT_538923 [Paraphoma chrysanthemicola]|uniref:Bacteriophage T5 Orf172 DNA-binding domain-containing protein n=1 Tax=Paraphoma chrysanthemicola TaxID=798071 RepID=A0A8K0VT73_9PLEO|nr:hypothetical protein FB567DRAFT_538923 [Paraphoma chrysanthemicola]